MNLMILRRIAPLTRRIDVALSNYLFDRFFGIDTRKALDRRFLDVEEGARIHAWSYVPCGYFRFRRVLTMLPVAPEKLTFVDIGSGRGRVLFSAALHGFRRVIGVEFSPELHASALRNLAEFTRHRSHAGNLVELQNVDATQYVLPTEPSLLFLFNPFQEPIMREFLTSIKKQVRTRINPLYLAYVHPTAKAILDESDMFDQIAEAPWITDAILYELRHDHLPPP